MYSFLTSGLDGGKWSASHPGCLTHRKEQQYPLNRRLSGSQSQSSDLGEGRDLGHPACSPVPMLTVLLLDYCLTVIPQNEWT